MVIVGGFGQALTLPIIAGVTLWFRYTRLDRRIRPARFLDILLWIAFISITAVATYAMFDQYCKATAPAVVLKEVSTKVAAPASGNQPNTKTTIER
jgi:hypothetical protein